MDHSQKHFEDTAAFFGSLGGIMLPLAQFRLLPLNTAEDFDFARPDVFFGIFFKCI